MKDKGRSPDDEVTVYFIIIEDGRKRQIQGWTEDKNIAKFYLEFHSCKRMKMKRMHGLYGDILRIIEENLHDEIKMYNIKIRNTDPGRKKNQLMKEMMIPATYTEYKMIHDEEAYFMSSMIDYHWVDGAYPYLKKKWQTAINRSLLGPIMEKVIHERMSSAAANSITASIEMDQLMILFSVFPDHFDS